MASRLRNRTDAAPARTHLEVIRMKLERLVQIGSFLVTMLTAAGIGLAQPVPLDQAEAAGVITYSVIDVAGFDSVRLSVSNLTSDRVEIMIPTGFVLTTGEVFQDLAVSETLVVTLEPFGSAIVLLPTLCVNMDLDVPGSPSDFTLLPSFQPVVPKLAATPAWAEASWRERQFAIWILLENPTIEELPGVTWLTQDHLDRLLLLLDPLLFYTLAQLPELALFLSPEEVELFAEAFAELSLPPVETGLDLVVLFAYGGPTGPELAIVAEILNQAGFDISDFHIFQSEVAAER